jgi:hypothetical protein
MDNQVIDRVLIGLVEILLVVCLGLAVYMVDVDFYEHRGQVAGRQEGRDVTCLKVRKVLQNQGQDGLLYDLRVICPPAP